MTPTSDRFEERLFDGFSGEIQPRPGEIHLGDGELRRLMRGRTRLREVERLGGHLASCADCREKLDALRRADESSRWRRAVSLARATSEHLHATPGRARLLERHVRVAAVVLVIVTLSIALGDRQRMHDSTAPEESLARGTASPAPRADPAPPNTLDPQTLVRALHAFDAYPPHRAAAYTIGLLRRMGVPLSSAAIAFDAATIYVVEIGDTWEAVAAKSLGDRRLWPMIVLLNLELTNDGEFVPSGTYLRVPKTVPLDGVE